MILIIQALQYNDIIIMYLNGLEKYFTIKKEQDFNCFVMIDQDCYTPLNYALKYHQNFNLNKSQWDYLLDNTNLTMLNATDQNYLSILFQYNIGKFLTNNQIDKIINKTNFLQTDVCSSNSLICFSYNIKNNLNLLNEKQINKMLVQSNLMNESLYDGIFLDILLLNIKNLNEINFSKKNWDYIFKNIQNIEKYKKEQIYLNNYFLHKKIEKNLNIEDKNKIIKI